MGIIINSDIERRLGSVVYVQLTDDERTGSADTDRVDEARLGAEGEVNSYLARRYAVPVDLVAYPETEALLKSMTLDLVEYRLHARRSPIPSDVARRRNEAIEWLGRMAAGQVHLPAQQAPLGTTATGVGTRIDGAERIFDRDSLRQL